MSMWMIHKISLMQYILGASYMLKRNNGKNIFWSHLANLYNRHTASGLGVRKLKVLTSFSKK